MKYDLTRACQETVSHIARTCATVSVNDLTARVWLCCGDGKFSEVASFCLPRYRKDHGVKFGKNKGIAGRAWERRKSYGQNFNGTWPSHKYNLSQDELQQIRHYTGYGRCPSSERSK